MTNTIAPPADELYAKDTEGHLIFTHDFCGGNLMPDSGLHGSRICSRCTKKFLPYEQHNRSVDGMRCTGRMKFLDTATAEPKKAERSVPRTFERECTTCGKKELYSRHEVIVVFRAGIGEDDARTSLKSLGLLPGRFRRDTHAPTTLACEVPLPRDTKETPWALVETLEKQSGLVRAAFPLLLKEIKRPA